MWLISLMKLTVFLGMAGSASRDFIKTCVYIYIYIYTSIYIYIYRYACMSMALIIHASLRKARNP